MEANKLNPNQAESGGEELKPGSINDILQKNQRNQMFHSSGYGVAQSGESMGAADLASFAARQAMEAKRQYIRGYRDSKLMQNQAAIQRARQYRARFAESEQAGEKKYGMAENETRNRYGAAQNEAPTPNARHQMPQTRNLPKEPPMRRVKGF